MSSSTRAITDYTEHINNILDGIPVRIVGSFDFASKVLHTEYTSDVDDDYIELESLEFSDD